MRARLGINTCFAVKRWPRPGDWARIVRDELGLEVVELSLDLIEDVGGRAADQVRSALVSTGYGPRPCSPAWPPTRSTC